VPQQSAIKKWVGQGGTEKHGFGILQKPIPNEKHGIYSHRHKSHHAQHRVGHGRKMKY
jgi:hypothetical protein